MRFVTITSTLRRSLEWPCGGCSAAAARTRVCTERFRSRLRCAAPCAAPDSCAAASLAAERCPHAWNLLAARHKRHLLSKHTASAQCGLCAFCPGPEATCVYKCVHRRHRQRGAATSEGRERCTQRASSAQHRRTAGHFASRKWYKRILASCAACSCAHRCTADACSHTLWPAATASVFRRACASAGASEKHGSHH